MGAWPLLELGMALCFVTCSLVCSLGEQLQRQSVLPYSCVNHALNPSRLGHRQREMFA